jgi:hypothetical protein
VKTGTYTHLINLCFLEEFPSSWTVEMIRGAMFERYSHLGDRLENIIVEELKQKPEKGKEGKKTGKEVKK